MQVCYTKFPCMKSTHDVQKSPLLKKPGKRKRNHTLLCEAAANEHGIQIAHLKWAIRVFEHPTNAFFSKK